MNKETIEKKTIAFYIGSLSRGGAERVMVNLARFFVAQNYAVYLVTKEKEEPEYEVPSGVTRLLADITKSEESSSRCINLFKRVSKLRKIWKEIEPDIIVSFIRKNNLMAISSSRGLKIPVLVGIRSNPARELQGKIFKPLSLFMFRFADGIIVQTTQGKEFMPGYLRKKTTIMPNSLSSQFVDRKIPENRRKEIAVVGRIDDNKNQRMVVEVFAGIREQYPDWSLHLYGDGGLYRKLCEEYSNEQIVFHGHTTAVEKYVEESAIFVLPSKQEGMPNALIEAMALGVACISTDCPCGGPADLIEDGVNGILIPVDDAVQLKSKLIELMEDDKLRETLGKNAKKIVVELNPTVVNEKWKNYIESFLY